MTLRGVQTAAFVNVVVTIAKVVPILVFIAIAAVGFKAGLFTADFWGKATQIDGAPLGDTMTQVKNMMLVTVWVFIGIEGAAVYSQRAAKRKDVGRATVLGFAGVLALLLLVNLLSYGLMAQAELAGVPDPSMAGVLENEVGSWGAAFISIGLVVSLLGALIAWVLLCVEILRLPAHRTRDAEGAGPRERPRRTGECAVADQPLRPGVAAVDARQREHLHQPGLPRDIPDPAALPVVGGIPGAAGGAR